MLRLKTKIKDAWERAFGKNLPVEHFAFLCVALAGIFMAAVGLLANYSLHLGRLTYWVPVGFIVVDVVCIVYSIITKRWKNAALVAVGGAVFVLFPFLWFTTGGATGSTMPLFVTSGLCIVVIFKGRVRLELLVLDAIMSTGFIVLEYFMPGLFVPYATRFAWYMDMAVCLLLAFVVNASLAYFVMGRYEKAKKDEEELVKKLERISLTDALTGVFNRRYLMACVDEEMRKCYDNGDPLCACIMDVDHFKRINDNYGHLYGDEVLIKIAQTVSQSLGEAEVFGRYGGEEFLVIFKGSTVEKALPKVENFCEKLRQTQWPHGGKITVSCGLSEYVQGISYSSFIENADKNLYKAKESGRDCIVA